MRVRKIDAENTRKLMELEDVIVLKHPYEILEFLILDKFYFFFNLIIHVSAGFKFIW